MSEFMEIIKSKSKPKEKVAFIANLLKADKKVMPELIAYFPGASIANRGTCIEAISEITKEDPHFADCCFDFVIAQINDTAPRVKWEAAQIVANAAREFPERASKAIPALLKNAEDEGTVVRWSAAKGLTEIAKYHPGSCKKLLPLFSKIIAAEDNNGVKNIYIKTLKGIEKSGASR
jgi:hypothetical protein